MNFNKLTPEEERVIIYKGTEMPFTGKYNDFFKEGTYVCKRCGTPLYKSSAKFKSECGWPSFDEEIKGAVKRTPDPDGIRTEINCAKCGAHLGHVFTGEQLTPKNTRFCVNSVSLNFVSATTAKPPMDTAIVAGGCFWGVERVFWQIPGVWVTAVGYQNGVTPNPTYEEVCSGRTGHAEAVEVVFDPRQVSYRDLLKVFWENHDPTQGMRQGNDIGTQYRSGIYVANDAQAAEAEASREAYQQALGNEGFGRVTTEIAPAGPFYYAEDYHQQYLAKNPAGYCGIGGTGVTCPIGVGVSA